MAIVTENVTVNSKQFKHIYSDAGYYIADSNSKNYVDVYDPEGSTKTYTETSVIIPQTVTQRYFEKRLLTKCDLDLSNSTRPHIIETYSNGTEWYRVFSDGYCEQGAQISVLSDQDITVTFLKPYSQRPIVLWHLSKWYSAPTTAPSGNNSYSYTVPWNITNTTFQARASVWGGQWTAVGYC